MENQQMNEKDLVNLINENYSAAKKILSNEIPGYAGVFRTALESAVKLFWLKKYGKVPVWVDHGREQFNLNDAINDIKFSSCFNQIFMTDINLIRKMCNKALHPSGADNAAVITVSDAQELFVRLEKCLREISRVINVQIIAPNAVIQAKIEKPLNNYESESNIVYNEPKLKHRWSWEEDKRCCEVFVENYIIANTNKSFNEVVQILYVELPQLKESSIKLKLGNIKAICQYLGLHDYSTIKSVSNYSNQNYRAMLDVVNKYKLI